MRDTSNSLLTAWIGPPSPDGSYDRVAWEPSRQGLGAMEDPGVKALAKLPAAGRRHVERALQDPRKRGYVMKLLRSSDPKVALARQAESDIAERVLPTGKPVVFDDIADRMGGLIRRAEDAMMKAMPNRDTEESRDLLNIMAAAKVLGESQRDVAEEYFMGLALESLEQDLSGWDNQDLALYGLDGLSRYVKKVGKAIAGAGKKVYKVIKSPVFKKIAIGVGIAAAAVVTGGIILPAIAPAIGGAAAAVGGAVWSGVTTVFGGAASLVTGGIGLVGKLFGGKPAGEATIPGSDGVTGGETVTMEKFLGMSSADQRAMLSAMGLSSKVPANWDSMSNDEKTAWMQENAGVEKTSEFPIEKIADIAYKVFTATPKPPPPTGGGSWDPNKAEQYRRQMEEQIYRQLLAQGMADAQARAYARQYADEYLKQQQPQGPTYQAPQYQAPQYAAPGYQAPGAQAPAQASLFGGIPTEYLVIGGLGLYFLTQQGGGGRRYRRNGRRRRIA